MRSLVSGRRVLTLLILVTLVLSVVLWNRDSSRTSLHAYFASAEGLNVGDDVRVLGVRIGEITNIENTPQGVYVSMTIDSDQPIPADASAAIVSPSLVSGRFVQFEPVYTSGKKLEDGATISLENTAVPVTFDDVKQQLTDLATTLGPSESNPNGALSEAITAIEKGLRNGNSTDLRQAITELQHAATALSDGRSDLFTTIKNLNTFTKSLALNDAALRGFTTELDDVSGVLAENRTNLSGAIRDLATVLNSVEQYLTKHRGRIKESASDLNVLAATLADRSNELAGILHVAPFPIVGLSNTVQNEAITGRATLSGLDNIAQLVCGAILGVGGTSEQCTTAIQPLLGLLGLSTVGGTE
ncbi:MCE family protein [Nocardioides sp. MH1]|uniref:MCE family protein n=1 Tax=Nocardioides sp. MH1 TaxID=3242490 RepID=UPI003520D5B8